jgi:hypothetical protein
MNVNNLTDFTGFAAVFDANGFAPFLPHFASSILIVVDELFSIWKQTDGQNEQI